MIGGVNLDTLLQVNHLRTQFITSEGVLPAVDDISFNIRRGETLGVVGESGCGKSVTALSIMRLIPIPPGRYASGKIIFEGENLLEKPEMEIRKIRGNKIAMIFQEPMTSLNPVYTVGDQIAEAIILHQGLSYQAAIVKAQELLAMVGIPDPERCVSQYPHQLSGGMRQRVMIAMALSCRPKLLIADEPTTALDVTIQAQILEVMKDLKNDLGMSMMLITHDLGVIAEMADRVVVMYAGKIVEEAPVKELFRKPLHPYTKGLYECVPRIDRPRGVLRVIEGVVPNPLQLPPGCRFHTRCPYAIDICKRVEPEFHYCGKRGVACHLVAREDGESVS